MGSWRLIRKPIAVVKTDATSGKASEETQRTEDGRLLTIKTVTDDGAGNLPGGLGTVNYVGKQVSLRVVELNRSVESYKSDFEDAAQFSRAVEDGAGEWQDTGKKGGEYGSTTVGEEMFSGASLVARYRVGSGVARSYGERYEPGDVMLQLCPYTSHRVVAGSVQFRWMGQLYEDFEGVIYRERTTTNPGIASGTIDYESGCAFMYDWVVGGSDPQDFTLLSLWTVAGQWHTASVFFNTEVAPLRPGPGGLVLTVVDSKGDTLTANIDGQGVVSGLHMWGSVEFSRGSVQLQFGDFVPDADLAPAQKTEWWYRAADVGAVQVGKIWRPWPVDPTTIRYSCVSYVYLPVDASLMGLDPAALPPNGRVPFARPGDTCVVGVTHSGPAFVPFVGQTYSVGHERLSFVQVLDDATGAEIRTGYTHDLDAGTLTFTDLSDYPAQVRVVGRTEVYRQIAEVRIDGKVRLTEPVGYAFPTGAVFSTALRQGDRFARVSRVYDQKSWSGTTWADGLDLAAGEATATYNHTGVPIEVTSLGAITERFALRLRSDGTTFDLIGKHLGQIASGTINEDFAPINTAAGAPYMTVKAAGWGAGWTGGNTLFVDTVGAEGQIALVRCTQPSSPAVLDDSFWLVQRGSVARPPGNE